ncbi:MAG: sugar isomerase [Kiritimatiellae bacterium]|nr:sugar isomerase [Kiritimatiellia bacterium]
MPPPRRPFRVKPILVYTVPERRERTAWRHWGGIQTEEDAAAEVARIRQELSVLKQQSDFPVEFLPVAAVRAARQVGALDDWDQTDAVIVYAAGKAEGAKWHSAFDEITARKRDVVFFLRHRSGPVYLWYEILSPRYLRLQTDQQKAAVGPDDVVVDEPGDLLWRLRALYGLQNTVGARILCIGGPAGWGCADAPQRAVDRFGFEFLTVSYEELGRLINEARNDARTVALARSRTYDYLRAPGVTLETTRDFVEACFLLDHVLRAIMARHGLQVVTVGECLGTVMDVARTTACLTLSLLNDDGYRAYCESDFVVIPAGLLMGGISGAPAFLNDPTFPHHGLVTLAHCTAPRCMSGKQLDPVRLVTHFESDYGAATKVEFRKDQVVTNVLADFEARRWLGVTGTIVDTPFLPICRSQMDVRLDCDTGELARQMRGFHWVTCYGSYLKELKYAAQRRGIEFQTLA